MSRAARMVLDAKTIEELRQGQAVLLTDALGLTFREAAQAMGVSAGWVSRLRSQFLSGQPVTNPDRPRRGGRRRANMSLEEEREFLSSCASRGVSTARGVKVALEERLGRPLPTSSVYGLLRRHGGLAAMSAIPADLDDVLERLLLDARR